MMEYSPKEQQYCTGCEKDLCVGCVQETIALSYEGRLLKSNKPRYEAFHWEDLDRFRAYLGDDVDPLKHGMYQAKEIAIPFIEFQNTFDGYTDFTQEQAKMLIIGNVLHDLHEGITGDIPEPDKNHQTAVDELEVNLECVKNVLHPSKEWLEAYRAVVGDIEGWSFAGRAFNAIERCGYFLSGVKAWNLRNHNELDDDEKAQSRAMGFGCIERQAPHLLELGKEFAYCWWLIKANETAVKQVVGDYGR